MLFSKSVYVAQREWRGSESFAVAMNKYLLMVTAVAITTVVVIDCILLYSKSALYTTPMPASWLHCKNMTTKGYLPSPKTPPWLSNATNTSCAGKALLYVWAPDSITHRLGNRLFTYASVYGIAWRNERMPILPDPGNKSQSYDLAKFFNLRMPTDQDNQIAQVNCYNGGGRLNDNGKS